MRLTVHQHRRQQSGNGNAGAQRMYQWPIPMDCQIARRQVCRDAEIRSPQVLDSDRAEMRRESSSYLVASCKSEKGKRVVVDGIRHYECMLQPLPDLAFVPVERNTGTYDRAHAAAAYHIDRHIR